MPSVESHQDILFDINSFGGFLNLLIYDFGNIDKQDPVFHLAEILSFSTLSGSRILCWNRE